MSYYFVFSPNTSHNQLIFIFTFHSKEKETKKMEYITSQRSNFVSWSLKCNYRNIFHLLIFISCILVIFILELSLPFALFKKKNPLSGQQCTQQLRTWDQKEEDRSRFECWINRLTSPILDFCILNNVIMGSYSIRLS